MDYINYYCYFQVVHEILQHYEQCWLKLKKPINDEISDKMANFVVSLSMVDKRSRQAVFWELSEALQRFISIISNCAKQSVSKKEWLFPLPGELFGPEGLFCYSLRFPKIYSYAYSIRYGPILDKTHWSVIKRELPSMELQTFIKEKMRLLSFDASQPELSKVNCYLVIMAHEKAPKSQKSPIWWHTLVACILETVLDSKELKLLEFLAFLIYLGIYGAAWDLRTTNYKRMESIGQAATKLYVRHHNALKFCNNYRALEIGAGIVDFEVHNGQTTIYACRPDFSRVLYLLEDIYT